MTTMTVSEALAAGLTRPAQCVECRERGYVTDTPDGEVMVDGSLRHLADNPLVLCVSEFGTDVTCWKCEIDWRNARRAEAYCPCCQIDSAVADSDGSVAVVCDACASCGTVMP